MSEMMSIKVNLPNLSQLAQRIGVQEGGKVNQFVTQTIANRMGKYAPVRTYNSVPQAIMQGVEPEHGRIVIRGEHIRYLYMGKVMVGHRPKKAIDKDFVYTTTYNRLAGPLWAQRLMAAEKQQIIAEAEAYIRTIKGGA